MSTRHRWFAAPIPFAACLLLLVSKITAGTSDPNAHNGPVGLAELIMLARQNDPKLVALRLNIPIAEAEKLAAKEWRDPEIRVGYNKDSNIQLDQPYTERGTIREALGNSSTERSGTDAPTFSDARETRTTSYTERVKPGANSDSIRRQETERRRTTTVEPDGTTKVEEETIRSQRDETRFHGRDRLARDHTVSVRARFYVPKPWEMKARIAQAAKEVELAKYKVVDEERQVVLEVREDYEKLQFLHRKLQISRSKIAVIKEHVAREQALLDAKAITIDKRGFEEIQIPAIEIGISAAEMELENAKRELAKRVGLEDGSRIRVTDSLLRSSINLESTDLDYLIRMAFVLRGEIGILKHEQAIAEQELALVKSKRIPWFSFIEAAYAKDSTGSRHTNDNYGVQFGVVLPLFSWLAKDEKVVEARIESYYGSLQANEKHIANEVAEAFRAVKRAASHRARARASVAEYKKVLSAKANSLKGSDNLAAIEQLRFETEEITDEIHRHVVEADRLYNHTLIRLEQALGADLDRVFSIEYDKLAVAGAPSGEVTAAAATSSAPKGKVRATEIVLPSQKMDAGSVTAKKEEKKRRGFGVFNRNRSKEKKESATPPAPKKRSERSGILRRRRK